MKIMVCLNRFGPIFNKKKLSLLTYIQILIVTIAVKFIIGHLADLYEM